MLSGQADELRELARRINELQGGAVRAVTMPANMGVALRDAADTILSLRDRVQELQAENAKLREERDHWHVEQVHAYGNWEDAHKRAIELEKQNAKLRELMYERAHVYAIQNMTEDELRITATNVMEDNAKLRELFSSYWKRTHSPVGPNVERDYLSEMRQLGIEVD